MLILADSQFIQPHFDALGRWHLLKNTKIIFSTVILRLGTLNLHHVLTIFRSLHWKFIFYFSLGSKGLQTGLKPKPVSSGPTPVSLFGNSNNEDEGGFLENAAGAVFGGDEGGLFGGSDGLFGGGNDEGPLDAIGDAIGDFFDGRKID